MSGPNPGVYMSLDETKKKVALKILKDGYIILNNDNYKNYLDGFTLSYRNGYYYDLQSKIDYNVCYNIDDYTNFLFNSDNQAMHEDILGLGVQRRFLKNNLDFKSNLKGFK